MKDICSVKEESWWSHFFLSISTTRWQVRNVESVFFWEDSWCKEWPLSRLYPRFYNLAQNKNSSVKEVISNCTSLNLFNWRRPLREWEQEQAEELLSCFSHINLGNGYDAIKWPYRDQAYSTRLGYKLIMGLDDSFTNHWRKVWCLRIPPKISLFLWKYQHDILPIQKVLNSRVPLKFSPNCSLCGIERESREHLFWNCYLVRKVWIIFYDWWSLNRNVMNGHGDLLLLLRCLKGVALREAWHTSVIALLWTIWLARNERIFSKQDWNEEKLTWLIKTRAFEWLLAAGKMAKGLESLWKVNPRGSCLLFNKKHKGGDFMWCNANFIGYSDGSWKLLPDN
ncbi:hypothetical protein DCAR_0207160 [Daucus carota subsp. sativus]|uniref:Reverse transcriptase zinc-binding domain-containing protein n=1 Tax=Daucus carota subsp. sativus TaxID=79200 RepID=A0AAF0WE91_DAUCS|nr:PREDICTED: uncharacterized protein LOC108207561 [Daucus carota subsp. sativus]WOG87927.1 hypothetical protein DCAR_0207160 [Daucus carota subsp. sativus]